MSVRRPINTAQTSFTPFAGAKQGGETYRPMQQGNVDGVEHSNARQTVQVEAQALYELWKDERLIPLWQEQVVSVTPLGEGRSHWVMGDPEDADGKRIEFDTVITMDVPGRRIAWQTTGGDGERRGEVEFAGRADGRGTVVTLRQEIKLGKLANAIASAAKRGPGQMVIENLRHFKQLAEAGEIPSVTGQPHGPRGVTGGIKEWLYGETNPTPPGTGTAEPEDGK